MQTILIDDAIAGSIAKFLMEGDTELIGLTKIDGEKGWRQQHLKKI